MWYNLQKEFNSYKSKDIKKHIKTSKNNTNEAELNKNNSGNLFRVEQIWYTK